MSADNEELASIACLPEEILVEIFRLLPASDLLCGVASTCWSWNWIVKRESECGRLIKGPAESINKTIEHLHRIWLNAMSSCRYTVH